MGGVTRPIGLDMTAAMLMGAGAGVDLPLLVELLPSFEAAIVAPRDADHGDDDIDGDE